MNFAYKHVSKNIYQKILLYMKAKGTETHNISTSAKTMWACRGEARRGTVCVCCVYVSSTSSILYVERIVRRIFHLHALYIHRMVVVFSRFGLFNAVASPFSKRKKYWATHHTSQLWCWRQRRKQRQRRQPNEIIKHKQTHSPIAAA